MPQQTDKWAQYADPLAPAAQPADRWAQYSDSTPVSPTDSGSSPSALAAPPESAFHELIDMGRLGKALIQSKMLGMGDPHLAYKYQDHIEQQLKDIGGDFAAKVGKAATVKDDPLYMMMKHRGPEPFESHDMLLNFIHDTSEFMGDPAIYGPAILGTLFGSPRAGANAGFALDAGLRKALTDHYQKGDIKSAGELANRVAGTVWEATKGLAMGEAMNLGGSLPAGSIPVASSALKGMYQAASMEVAGSILNWHMPTLESFERNAITVTGLNLITHGASQVLPDTKQGLLDVYAKDGTTPEQSATKLQAQPPVKPAPPDGLQPAIRLTAKDGSTQVISGEHATHGDLAEQTTGSQPVSMEQLEADPKLAQRVLDRPETHEQSVIDKASELSASLGGPDGKSYLKQEPPKSGRGFQTPDGKYLNRSQAKNWVKANEPDVYDKWTEITGDAKAEMHSADYQEARSRVSTRNVLEGEANYSAMTPENAERIAAFRKDLNDEKLQDSPRKYGETLRAFFTGQRDLRTTIATNLRDSIRRVLPDLEDRQALTFIRDYKGNEQALRDRLTAIQNRDVVALGVQGKDPIDTEEILDRLEKTVPSIEKALAPTPEMKAVDSELTNYANSTFKEANGLGILDSTIPPENYITHILREADEEGGGKVKGLGRPKMARGTPFANQRKYATTLDAMAAGKVPGTLDAADAIAVYGDRHATAVATRLFATELKNSELGKWGTSKDVPSDWRKLGEGRVFEYIGTNPDTGENFSTSFMVPGEIADAMKPITERKTLFQGPIAQKVRRAQSYIKSADMALSIFHMKALTINAMNNMSYANFIRSAQTDIHTPEFNKMVEQWAGDGLVTTRSRISSDVYEGLTALPSKASIADSVAGIKQLKQAARAITHQTFDVLQTRYKVTDAATKDAAWMAKHPEATEQEHFAARRSIAKEVNAVYGGLNWENMGLGANQVELMRALILAPDWTISNLANLKYTAEGGAGGAAARMFWAKSISTGLVLTQLTSFAISGHLSKNLTQVYLGKDKQGKELYSSWFFAGAPKDLATWINAISRDGGVTGTAQFISYKLAPLVGTVPRLLVNKDWSGQPITKPTQGAVEKTGREAAFVAGQVLPAPFAIKDAAQMLIDPDRDYTQWDFINMLAGSTTSHQLPTDPTTGKPVKQKRKGFHIAGSGSSKRVK